MKNHTSFGFSLAGLFAAAWLFVQPDASAKIVGPYTVDANTLHLWHLDESGVPAIDSVANLPGTNCINLTNGAVLGTNSYAGFGTALSTIDGGQDNITGTARDAFLSPVPGNPGTATGPFTYANAANGAFTYEANVWIGFDPLKNFGTVARFGNGRDAPCQIMSMEGGSGKRLFQFRIVHIGEVLLGSTLATVPTLTFENIRGAGTGDGGQPTIYASIPTNGPDAIVSNQWYHVAVSYNGVPSTANNIKFYWTLMDTNRGVANQIPITSAQATCSGPNPAYSPSPAASFEIGNQARNNNGNFLGTIDEVRMSSIERGPADMRFTADTVHVVTQPADQFVAAGDNVSVAATASGQPIRYQWQYNGADISPLLNPTATNATLLLTNITLGQAGSYRLVVTNNFPSSDISATAIIRVGHTSAETFNTGLSPSRTLLSGGEVDPHWQLVQSDDPNFPGPAAVVVGSPPGTYLANGPSSMWLAPVSTGNAASGDFTYRTTFLLDTLDSANAVLSGGWAMDNGGVDILLNGVSQGLTATGFGGLTRFTLTSGFVPGVNTLDLIITNFPSSGGPNPTGLRAELRGVGLLLSNVAPYLTEFPVNISTQSQQTASFQVATVGSGPLAYQWYKGVTPLTGQTNRTLVLSRLTPGDADTYSVTITNSLGSTNASATLAVITPPALAWLGIDPTSPSFWDSLTVNWLDTTSSNNVAFATYDDVIFDARGSATPTVDLIEPLHPNSVVVDAATDYTLSSVTTGAGAIIGTPTLTKKNTGKLILDTANTYSGGTIIEGGILQVGNADATGTLGSGAVSNNAALEFNRTDSFTVANAISGTGTVTMAGSGTLALTAKNTYSGPTVVSAGTIYVRNSTALGDTTSGTTVANGAQLRVWADVSFGAEPLTLSGLGYSTPLEGALHIDGGGVGNICGSPITLAADAGIKVDASGTLSLTNAAGITGTDVSLFVQADSTGVRGTVTGPITLGTGSFIQYGAATWVLLATNNNWAGTTTINSPAVLQIGDGGTNGSIGGSSIVNDGTLTFLSARNLLITNVISGGGPLNQNGTGMVTLTAANSYSGVTTIRGSGVLRITDGAALGGGQCTIGVAQTDTCRLELLGGITVANQIAILPRVWYQTPPPSPVVAPDIVNVGGTNTLSPPASITVAAGGNLLTLQSDSGKLILTAGVTAAGAGRHLALRGAAYGEIQGNIDRTGANSQSIWKLDSGTWTLSGALAPGAATTVSNGMLVVSGSLESTLVTVAGGTLALTGAGTLTNATPVTVAAGATLDASGRTDDTLTIGTNQSLSGNGTIVGNLFVQGTLTPGASVGRLSASANIAFDSTAQTVMEVNNAAATNDLLAAVGTVTYGGTLTITNINATAYTNNQVLKLFSAGGYAGSFSNIVFRGVAVYDTSKLTVDGTIKVAAPLSTAPTNLTATVTDGNTLVVGWPLNHTTWRLLAQTNAPGLGLTPSWFEVPGSASTNQMLMPLDPAAGSVFYRLVYP